MPNNELKDFKQRFEEGEFAQSAELSTRYLDENILIFDNIRVLANPDPVRLHTMDRYFGVMHSCWAKYSTG